MQTYLPGSVISPQTFYHIGSCLRHNTNVRDQKADGDRDQHKDNNQLNNSHNLFPFFFVRVTAGLMPAEFLFPMSFYVRDNGF